MTRQTPQPDQLSPDQEVMRRHLFWQWGRALLSLAFAPAGMRQIIRLYSVGIILGLIGTTAVVMATSPWPEPEPEHCRAGVVTSHNLMPYVLAEHPERRDVTADAYFAPVRCQDLGKAYRLYVAGDVMTVRAIDCAAWSVGEWPQKGGADWLGDLGREDWPDGEPLAPLRVLLCENGERRSSTTARTEDGRQMTEDGAP